MAVTKTDIINKALTLIGAAEVTNIDDQSTNANVLSRSYETALRAILSETRWNFATKRSLLSLTTDTAEWYDTGETYIYNKPAELIRIFDSNDRNATWREEGDKIFSDTSGLGLRYTYYLDTPSKYPMFFTAAFIDLLASDISYAIVSSATMGEKYKTLYESVSLPKAMAANAQTGLQQTMRDDAWELAKYNDIQVDA